MIKDTNDDLGMVLIAPRSWALFDAFVAAFKLTPAHETYTYPQLAEGALEMTYEDILAFLKENVQMAEYDLYMRKANASGVVVGVRPDGFMFGLPARAGVKAVEAFCADERITEGYVWSDDPLPETIAEARVRQMTTQLGRLQSGRFVAERNKSAVKHKGA